MMTVTSFAVLNPSPIETLESRGTAAIPLAAGDGEAHVYFLRFEPGGEIGRHPAGFGQLFVVLSGSGWVSGRDDERVGIGSGEVAAFARGEIHAKGSEAGMTALMIQVRDMTPDASAFPVPCPPPTSR
jgi:quercetin dioxygenase-like cupin family protein